ncbi:MAG TPA: HD domain-containing phosphohydrolase [Humisphaera sp.]
MKVLLADDDDITLELVAAMLRRRGYDVDTVSDGRQALEFIARGEHRIVISDWEMPNLSGTQLCEAIRAGDFGGYVYTILLTGRNKSGDSVAGLNAGADDFITKPVDPDQLAARVRIAERILSFQTQDVTIFALAKLAESRDPETGAHLERVRSYSRVLAEHLTRTSRHLVEGTANYAQLIYRTSPLHDIGKVGIPDHVLLKPGRLSDEEFEIMKSHTLLGARTLEAALKEHPEASFLRMALDIALTHHERWDGTGYPNRLKGEAIPLCGRVVALADVYDALTSKRVYKGAFSHSLAKAMILKESGTHFDPAVVDAFVACEAAFVRIAEKYQDRNVSLAA